MLVARTLVLLTQGARVPFLVRELRSHMPCDMAKRKKKKKTADFSKDMEELKF